MGGRSGPCASLGPYGSVTLYRCIAIFDYDSRIQARVRLLIRSCSSNPQSNYLACKPICAYSGYMVDTLPAALIEDAAERFKVLGHPSRLAILRALLADGELSVSELVTRLDMGQANVSKQLKALADARFVSRRREGTAAFYSVTDPNLPAVCELICGSIRTQAIEKAARITGA